MNLLDPNLDELLNVAIDARRKQEREDALDEPAERLRDLLERKYASWLKANKEVTPELDAVLLAEFRKFSEWSGKSGPSPSLPPRSVFVATYLDHRLEAGVACRAEPCRRCN